jgi:hypothetical protein
MLWGSSLPRVNFAILRIHTQGQTRARIRIRRRYCEESELQVLLFFPLFCSQFLREARGHSTKASSRVRLS